ncbi:hypothetical protein CHUAL_012200 [Chamberlinius hualienensis]
MKLIVVLLFLTTLLIVNAKLVSQRERRIRENEEDSKFGWKEELKSKESSYQTRKPFGFRRKPVGSPQKSEDPSVDPSYWENSKPDNSDSSIFWGKPDSAKSDSSIFWGKPDSAKSDSSIFWGKPNHGNSDSSIFWGTTKPTKRPPHYWGKSNPGSPDFTDDEPDLQSWLEDGTSIKSKLLYGKQETLRCRCNIQSAFKVIEGESFNKSKFAIVETACNKKMAGKLRNGAMVAYYNVDFGKEEKAKALEIHMSNGSPETEIVSEVRVYIDNPFGKPFVKFYTHPTGDWCKFFLFKSLVDEIVTGIHDVYFVITSDPSEKVGAMDMDWFVFTSNLDQPKCPKF